MSDPSASASPLQLPLQLDVSHRWDGTPLPRDRWRHVKLSASPGGLLFGVEAPFFDDPIPQKAAGPCGKLWEHEVIELFIVGGPPSDKPRYLEIEVGPHGHHLVLKMHGRRQIVAQELPIRYGCAIEPPQGDAPARWRGHAEIPWSYLPPLPHRINAFAIGGRDPQDTREYAAWTPVPGDKPDFHRLEYFVDARLVP